MKMRSVVIMAASAFFANAALAAEDFPTVDANSDGEVTWAEAAARAPQMTDEDFKEADSNGNGSLSPGEYIAAMTQ